MSPKKLLRLPEGRSSFDGNKFHSLVLAKMSINKLSYMYMYMNVCGMCRVWNWFFSLDPDYMMVCTGIMFVFAVWYGLHDLMFSVLGTIV